LKFKEKQELERLPERIEKLESQVERAHQAMADPDFYQKPGPEIAAEQAALKELEQELAALYVRWEELEQIAAL
jgi:ATP-binding cassette subfamily F protein uup